MSDRRKRIIRGIYVEYRLHHSQFEFSIFRRSCEYGGVGGVGMVLWGWVLVWAALAPRPRDIQRNASKFRPTCFGSKLAREYGFRRIFGLPKRTIHGAQSATTMAGRWRL